MSNKKVKYSICICNYNMSDTIESSLNSLITQLDEKFEIVLVDDGSTDSSLSVLSGIQSKYPDILKVIPLPRDRFRKLGMTRNISINEASGDFVILHLDCDDVFGPFIVDFLKVFHKIENAVGRHILLSGKHINVANRKFLLEHGPYKNIYRGEDRELWGRLGKIDSWIPLEHVDFIVRLPRTKKVQFFKTIYDSYDHMKYDFRQGFSLLTFIKYEVKKWHMYSIKLRILRAILLLPAWFFSKLDSKISLEGNFATPEEFALYRESTKGTYEELMKRYGGDPSLDFLIRDDAKNIFS